MEMVYLINGNGSGGGGSSGGGGDGSRSAGYPLVKAVVTDGAVGLQDRSVTRVELKTSKATTDDPFCTVVFDVSGKLLRIE